MNHQLAVYTATLEARARGWVGLEEDERKRRAVLACQGYELEELWSLTEAHLYAFGRKKSRTSDCTLREYRRGVKVLLEDARNDGLNFLRPRREGHPGHFPSPACE